MYYILYVCGQWAHPYKGMLNIIRHQNNENQNHWNNQNVKDWQHQVVTKMWSEWKQRCPAPEERCIHFGKHFKFPWQFLIHLSIFTVSSWNSTPGYLPKRNENIYPHKDLSHCFIHGNWKLARTKRPWTGERTDRLGYTHAMQYGIPAHQQKGTNYWCTYVTKRWSSKTLCWMKES